MKAKAKPAKYEGKRREVLQAAARVFSRLGFHRASMNDIAADLGITPAALYYYEKSKDELLLNATQVAAEQMLGWFAEAETSVPAEERLRYCFREYAAFVCTDFGRCIAVTQTDDLPSPHKEIVGGWRRQIELKMRALVQEAMARGALHRADEKVVTGMIFGGLNTLPRWWNPKGKYSPAEVADQMLDALLVESSVAPDARVASAVGTTGAPGRSAARN